MALWIPASRTARHDPTVRLDLVLVQDLLRCSVVKIKTLALFVLSLPLAACSSTADEDGEGSGDPGETLDLFACNVSVNCMNNVGDGPTQTYGS